MTRPQPTAEQPKIKNVASIGWFQQCVHRSRHGIFSEVKSITPQMAEVILSNNADNRRVRPKKLAQMVSDMKNGRWSMNGEPIIVASTGELNDGQHRLMALIDSKTTQPMLFVFGVERDTRTTVDQGATRAVGDYLQMDGVQNTSSLAAIARHMISYEKAGKTSLGRPTEMTPAEILQRAESDKTLWTSAKYADLRKAKMKRYCTATVIGLQDHCSTN